MKLNFDRKDVEEKVLKWRRDLHEIPEYGFDLVKTTAYVRSVLDELGIEYKSLVQGSAVVGLIKGEMGEGKTLGLRADMDALRIQEETGLPFASKHDGMMHACGHDAHTAMLLGAAYVLNNNRDKFKGNIKLLFQPSEEQDGGAKPMIDEGCLEDPKVDYVIGQHVGNLSTEIQPGQFGFYPGAMMASIDRFTIEFVGQGGHGALPHLATDPIIMAASAIQAFQSAFRREIDTLDPMVFTIGQVHGGSAYNIIPDRVSLNGTVRTLNEEVREKVRDRATTISKSIAEAFNGHAEIDYEFMYPVLNNDVELTAKARAVASELFGEESICDMTRPTLGSEDFSYYSKEVPSCFVFINTAQEFEGVAYPNHNSKFMVDESQLIKGVEYFCSISTHLLMED